MSPRSRCIDCQYESETESFRQATATGAQCPKCKRLRVQFLGYPTRKNGKLVYVSTPPAAPSAR